MKLWAQQRPMRIILNEGEMAYFPDFLTTAIAACVGVIGYMQWRTAHQKVMLDLFDRRVNFYDDVISAVESALSAEGREATYNIAGSLSRLRKVSRFIFGPEIERAIEEIERNIIE